MKLNLSIAKFFILPIVTGLFLFAPSQAFCQNKNIENKKAQAGKLEQDIQFLDKQIEQTKKQRKNTIAELNLLKKKADVRQRMIERLEKDITRQGEEISDKAKKLALLQSQLDTLKMMYKRMVIKAYRNRDSRKWFMYIIASNNVEQGYRRWSYLKNYSKALSAEAKKIKAASAELEKEKSELSKLQAENRKTQHTKEEELNKLKKDQEKNKNLEKSLAKQQSKYTQELKQKKEQAARLSREIEKMIAEAIAAERKKAAGSSKTTTTTGKTTVYKETPESARLSGSFENNRGKLPWPVKRGVIVEGFGEHPHPTIKGVKLPFNNGVNISAPTGCNVYSVYEGVVKKVIVIPGYSNCVLVEHGKYFTFYCKLGRVNVKAGQKIATGALIGTLDTKQESSELHFELWNGTQKQNPELWLKQ